tara:strand:+ start:1886 stop:2293 length:408 start_codon:yes stop_codon:yes gene_type:complete
MTNRRNKLLKQLMKEAKGETETKLLKLTMERICADMCEYYSKFYANEGPGAMVYVPDAEDQKKSMFYLTVDHMINALDDFNKRDMDGVAEVMKKAIARAEPIDPEKESLFIIQDKDNMSLVHYKHDCENANFIKM